MSEEGSPSWNFVWSQGKVAHLPLGEVAYTPKGRRQAAPENSLPATWVIELLERLRENRGLPEVIVVENGLEFTSRAFDSWA